MTFKSAGMGVLFAAFVAAAPASAQTASGAGFPISDVSTHSSTITVSDSGTVTGVTFNLDRLGHTFISDLFATLTHDSTTVSWLNRSGGSANLGGDYLISDAGLTTLGGGSGDSRTSGTYAPIDPLSAFIGGSASGDWTLTIADQVGGDTGSLQGWRLNLNAVAGTAPEPATWAMMLMGFGAIGFAMRHRREGELAAA